jgi:penicillin amidase
MLIATLLLLTAHQSIAITRDEYGVPHIQASTKEMAFYEAGYAVAQDRLWQMEMSRRIARGKLAEVLGAAFVASDAEVLKTGYTDQELSKQYESLSPDAKAVLSNYVNGVNAWITEASSSGLPVQYTHNGFKPEPWTILDSVAICVRLMQQFGRGGAGELRNMAALAYLQNQKPLSNHVLDVWDDMAWFNDPDAIPTISSTDDPIADSHVTFYKPDRKTTESHLAMLPKVSLLQLMSGVRVSEREQSTRVATNLSTPFQTGSYCVVVGSAKSATGRPLLLSGPQMGMNVPSICHEMSIEAPGLATVGMDVPGVPGIIVGETRNFAWGLTSGVADTDDIFYFPSDGSTYQAGSKSLPLEKLKRTLKVKGAVDREVEQQRTIDGPVVLNASKTVFSKRSSYWMHEMDTFRSWVGLWSATNASGIDAAVDGAAMNFNFFYATVGGDIGWRYLGLVPKRASGIDPRFPTPGDPKYAWRGFLTSHEMPHARNPKAGFFANWNNKPTAWWPNSDTPAWGKVFRNSTLISTLQAPKLTLQDLEMSAWTIARTDENWEFFKSYIDQCKDSPGYDLIKGFDGRTLDGSRQAAAFQAFIFALRQEVFLKSTGNFLNPEYFNTVLQPSLLLRALEGKTKFNYIGRSTARQVVQAALAKMAANPPPPYRAPTFRSLDPTPIPYSNRGTYIQVIEFLVHELYGRNILPPGVSESGPHANDQSPLARAWQYKPMHFK